MFGFPGLPGQQPSPTPQQPQMNAQLIQHLLMGGGQFPQGNFGGFTPWLGNRAGFGQQQGQLPFWLSGHFAGGIPGQPMPQQAQMPVAQPQQMPPQQLSGGIFGGAGGFR
jgi:hypothetical protein